jgi:hypothetical protein
MKFLQSSVKYVFVVVIVIIIVTFFGGTHVNEKFDEYTEFQKFLETKTLPSQIQLQVGQLNAQQEKCLSNLKSECIGSTLSQKQQNYFNYLSTVARKSSTEAYYKAATSPV